MSAWGAEPEWGSEVETAPAEHARRAREILSGDGQSPGMEQFVAACAHALTGLLLLEIGKQS